MTEIVNLRTARKQRARKERKARAAANRAKFGRTKAERQADGLDAARAARDIDGKRLENRSDKTPATDKED